MSKTLTRGDMEEIAVRLLTEYYRGDFPRLAPVDITALVTEFSGMNLRYERLSDTGRILGLTTYRDITLLIKRNDAKETLFLPKNTILIESDLTSDAKQPGRLHFTIAHEYSHQLLFGFCPDEADAAFRTFDTRTPCPPSTLSAHLRWSEYMANTLGAALLMPKPLMEWVNFVFNPSGEKITLYGKRALRREREIIHNMATFLGVSKEALKIRLKGLDMVKVLPEDDFDIIADI
jgi:Zn-dependent peptidase ImmA (M78 family)